MNRIEYWDWLQQLFCSTCSDLQVVITSSNDIDFLMFTKLNYNKVIVIFNNEREKQ